MSPVSFSCSRVDCFDFSILSSTFSSPAAATFPCMNVFNRSGRLQPADLATLQHFTQTGLQTACWPHQWAPRTRTDFACQVEIFPFPSVEFFRVLPQSSAPHAAADLADHPPLPRPGRSRPTAQARAPPHRDPFPEGTQRCSTAVGFHMLRSSPSQGPGSPSKPLPKPQTRPSFSVTSFPRNLCGTKRAGQVIRW